MTPFGKKKGVHSLNMGGLSVFVGMPTHRDNPAEVTKAFLETQEACITRGIKFQVSFEIGCSIVEMARSKVAWRFLQSDCSRLFWIDSDVTWRPMDFIRLLALSTKMDIVCGAYPAKMDQETFMIAVDEDTVIAPDEYGCVRVNGLGMGFACMTRGVVEVAAAEAPKMMFPEMKEPIPHIFRCDTDGKGTFRGEDMAFFADCIARGYSVNIDPSIELGHIGAKTYRGKLLDVFKRMAAAPSDDNTAAPGAA